MIPRLIDNILDKRELDLGALEAVMQQILGGTVNDSSIAGLLIALRTLPVDSKLLSTLAGALRSRRRAIKSRVTELIDTCGTGGDGLSTINISTAAAFVVAACGGAVAKHGNRSVSSKSGSADVMEAIGVPADLQPDQATRMLDATGFTFLFAPIFHPTVAHVMPARRALGVRTVFNLLGPLVNPALAPFQLLGVYDPLLTNAMADALCELGSTSALVIHCEGLDEIGLHGVTRGHLLRDEEVTPFEFDPTELGLPLSDVSELLGGNPAENAVILELILDGEQSVRADVVALNAGAALMVAGIASDMADGFEQARAACRNGRARRALERARQSGSRLSEPQGTPLS